MLLENLYDKNTTLYNLNVAFGCSQMKGVYAPCQCLMFLFISTIISLVGTTLVHVPWRVLHGSLYADFRPRTLDMVYSGARMDITCTFCQE